MTHELGSETDRDRHFCVLRVYQITFGFHSVSNVMSTVGKAAIAWISPLPKCVDLSPNSFLSCHGMCLIRPTPGAARFLGLRVWIPLRTWMFVSCECCALCVTGRSLVQGSPTECVCVCVCVSDCDQVQQEPSTPTVSRQTEVKTKKEERKNVFC
jgi:hypothetical protein